MKLETYDDLKEYLHLHEYPNGKKMLHKSYAEFKEHLISLTSFLDTGLNRIQLGYRLMCITEEIYEIPSCSVCGNKVKSITESDEDIPYKYKFSLYCSKKCLGKSDSVKEKRKQTSHDKYGVSCIFQSEETKKRIKQTNLTKYGVENPSQAVEVKEKRKQTLISRYGVDNPMKHQPYTDALRQTNLDKYGHPYATQSDIVKEKMKQTNLSRYGVPCKLQLEETKKQIKQTNLSKYGTEYPSQSAIVKEKMKQTNRIRYGGDNPMAAEQTRQKIRQTNLSRYGVEYAITSINVREKTKLTMMEVHGAEYHNQGHIPATSLEILKDKEKLREIYEIHKNQTTLAKLLEVDATTVSRYMIMHELEVSTVFSTSVAEREICDLLDSWGIVYESNTRAVISKELDIYIPSHNLAIEYNGVYWHSDKFKDRYYHMNKSLECKAKGILLLHIWEDNWLEKKNIVIGKLKSKLGLASNKVYARKTQIDILKSSEAREFMDKTHIQGATSASVWLGLRHNGVLVATLGIKRFNGNVWDLVRFSTSTNVVGGFTKLLSYFKKNYDWNEIFTFADLDYSHGDVYEKSGFVKAHDTVPSMFYVKNNKRYRRERFMKHKLYDLFGDNFDPTKTERENMLINGYLRLYDAGNIKYRMMNII